MDHNEFKTLGLGEGVYSTREIPWMGEIVPAYTVGTVIGFAHTRRREVTRARVDFGGVEVEADRLDIGLIAPVEGQDIPGDSTDYAGDWRTAALNTGQTFDEWYQEQQREIERVWGESFTPGVWTL